VNSRKTSLYRSKTQTNSIKREFTERISSKRRTMVAPAHNHAENFENLQELTLWMGASFTRAPRWAPDDPACSPERWKLPRQRIDVCTASNPVLPQDPPQEPAKEQSGAAAADRTPTPKSVTEPRNTKSKNTQEISRNRANSLSQ